MKTSAIVANVLGLTLCVGIAGFALFSAPDVEVRISEKEMKEFVGQKTDDYDIGFKYGDLQVDEPKIELEGDTAYATVQFKGEARVFGVGYPFSGEFTVSSKLGFDKDQIKLAEPSAETLRIDGISQRLANKFKSYIGNGIIERFFDGMTVYTLTDEQKEELPPLVEIKNVEIADGEIVVTLGL